MVYGYGRISTLDRMEHKKTGKQLIYSQIQELKKQGAEIIMYDEESGLKEDREELNKLLNLVKAGDYIICVEPSRISRSVIGMCKILKKCEEKQVGIKLGHLLDLDFTKGSVDPFSIAMSKIITTFSELEVELIRSRIKRGLLYSNKPKGRPKTTYEDVPEIFFKYLPMYNNGTINKSEYSRITGLSYPSIYKYLEIVNSK